MNLLMQKVEADANASRLKKFTKSKSKEEGTH